MIENLNDVKIKRIMNIDVYRDGGSSHTTFLDKHNNLFKFCMKYNMPYQRFSFPTLIDLNSNNGIILTSNNEIRLTWKQAKKLFNSKYTIDKEDGWHSKKQYIQGIKNAINREFLNENN